MHAMQQSASNVQPAPTTTLESVTQEIYDALLGLGGEIEMVEGRLSTLLHADMGQQANGLQAIEKSVPEAVQKLQGLRDSVHAYRQRVESLRFRLAV